jgi:probable F420-dependent oxidoreductase
MSTSRFDPGEQRYWAAVVPLPGALLSSLAKQAEAQGLHGLFATQVHGAPFSTLAAAAVGTRRIELATGIAIASTRSPFETAMNAMDLDRISEGRFVLGLGASSLSWTRGMHGVPVSKPLTHLKETVCAVRHIVANAHKGLEPFEGEYYRADFEEFQATSPPVRERIPIWTAALRERAVRVAGEVSDGLIGHPIWSVDWAEQMVGTELAKGLDQSGRTRKDIHVNLWIWTALSDDPGRAIEDARGTVAFYAGLAQYEPYFEAQGFGEEARRIHEPIARGDLETAGKLVPDEMVRSFVACGTEDEVRVHLDRAWKVADSICLVPPAWGLGSETTFRYQARVGELIAGG